MIFAGASVRNLRMLACVVLCCVGFSEAPAEQPPLTVGIKRTQQELERIIGMINENKKEQAWVLTEAFADGTSIVTAGALKQLKHAKDAKRISELWEVIKNAADSAGKLTDFADAADDFKNGDRGLLVSDALKELLDLLGSVPGLEEIGIANNVNDLGIKAAQWRALQVENDELLKVVAKLTVALNRLLAKDPVTQARIQAAARKASQDAVERQRAQAELFRQYYKDKPRTIELAVRQAAARGPDHAFQVAQGIMIVDPQADVDALAKIPGINPDFIESLRKQFELLRKGDLESVQLAGEINKYDYNTPNWSYINVFGAPRAPIDAITTNTIQPEIKIEYKPQRSGATGIVLFGSGALLFDSTNQHKVGQLFSYPQEFNSGNYVVDFSKAGFSPLPVEVRQGSLTVVTVPLAGINLQTDSYKRACVCLSKDNAILTTSKRWDSVKICKERPNTLEWPYPFWVAPGAYEVVTVDKSTSGSCTNHAQAGYSPIAVTLEDGGVVYVKTHSGGGSSTFVCHAKDYPEPGSSEWLSKCGMVSTCLRICLPDWWSSDLGNH